MEVILRKDSDKLGLEGEVVNVTKGYARNYLIPKGIAFEANSQNLKAFEAQRKKIEVNRLKAKEDAEELKQKMEGMLITFSHKAGEEGKLYGSVTSMDIASHLEKQGIVIDRRKILLEKPVKTLGEFDLSIKLHPEVTGLIKLVVVPEQEKEE